MWLAVAEVAVLVRRQNDVSILGKVVESFSVVEREMRENGSEEGNGLIQSHR